MSLPGVEAQQPDEPRVNTADTDYMSGADFYNAIQDKQQNSDGGGSSAGVTSGENAAIETTLSTLTAASAMSKTSATSTTSTMSLMESSVDRFKPLRDLKDTQPPSGALQHSKRTPKKDSTNVIFNKVDMGRTRRVRNEGSWHLGQIESGMGMVAMRFIHAGDLVFSEKAFVSFHIRGASPTLVAKHVRATLSKFTRSKSREAAYFTSLHTVTSKATGTEPDEFGILQEYGTPFGKGEIGVFVNMSSLRHSCAPNLEISISASGIVTCYAVRDIRAGEELTRSIMADLFANSEERHYAYQTRFPGSSGCRCFVCETNSHDENLRRKTILANLIAVKGISHHEPTQLREPALELKSIERLLALLEAHVVIKKGDDQVVHRDVKLLRQMHAKASQLSLKLGFHYDGMRHLTTTAGYFILSFGRGSPESQRVVNMVEKRGLQPCPVQNLPIFAINEHDVHRWGAPGESGPHAGLENTSFSPQSRVPIRSPVPSPSPEMMGPSPEMMMRGTPSPGMMMMDDEFEESRSERSFSPIAVAPDPDFSYTTYKPERLGEPGEGEMSDGNLLVVKFPCIATSSSGEVKATPTPLFLNPDSP
jgi:hypothetical protein